MTTMTNDTNNVCTADDLRKPIPVKIECAEVPEFGPGKVVYVKGMTAREKSLYDQTNMNSKWTGINRAKFATSKERLLCLCLCDEGGTRLFSEADVPLLQDWPADLMNRLWDIANKLCGGDSADEASKKNDSDETDDD